MSSSGDLLNINDLSQAQQVCLSRAIILKPKFIILDEPTSSLDVVIQDQILQLL